MSYGSHHLYGIYFQIPYSTCLDVMELECHFIWNYRECLCYVKLILLPNTVICLEFISFHFIWSKWNEMTGAKWALRFIQCGIGVERATTICSMEATKLEEDSWKWASRKTKFTHAHVFELGRFAKVEFVIISVKYGYTTLLN